MLLCLYVFDLLYLDIGKLLNLGLEILYGLKDIYETEELILL